MNLTSKIIATTLLLIMTACSTSKTEPLEANSSNSPKKYLYYSLQEYDALSREEQKGGMGDEYIQILKDDSLMSNKYPNALKHVQTISLKQPIKGIQTILKNENFFNDHKNIFEPFNASALSRILYKNNKALVSFGFMTGKHSFTFGDYILELKDKKVFIYTLTIQGACGG